MVNENVVQQNLAQYHQLASELRNSNNIQQAALALETLVNIEYEDQIAYLKALGQEDSSDAADVAQAMYNIAPNKEVRKEARRTLLRLEGQNTYPQWNITAEGLVAPSVIHLTEEDFSNREQTEPQDKAPLGLDSLLQDLENFFESLPDNPAITSVTTLLESLADGDPNEAYNALSPRSALREELDADTWVERRVQWLKAANTSALKIAYIGEKDKLALDSVIVEAFWSLSINNPTAENPPKDLPTPTCVLTETGRHWYWTNYVVIEEGGEWHITDMTDEGVTAFQLPSDEVERLLRENVTSMSQLLSTLEDEEDFEDFDEEEDEEEDEEDEEEDFDEEDTEEEDEEDEENEEDEDSLSFLDEMEEVIRQASLAMHYHDALIYQAPNDGSVVYQSAIECAQIIQDTERAAAYFKQLAQNIPDYRAKALRGLSLMYEQILQEQLDEHSEDLEPTKQYYNELIEKALRQATASDETVRSDIWLAEFLVRNDKNLDEAEMLLQKAQPLATEEEDIVSVEAGLAQIAHGKDQYEEALQHYQKVASLDTEFPHIWFHIGSLHRQLENFDEAIFNLRRSVKEDPDFTEAYIELSVIYSDQKQFNKARDILRKGLDKTPDSVDLIASLSITYAKSGDLQSAQRYLQQAERLDAQNVFVPIARAMLQAQKEQKSSASHPTAKSRNQPKHRSHKHKKK